MHRVSQDAPTRLAMSVLPSMLACITSSASQFYDYRLYGVRVRFKAFL